MKKRKPKSSLIVHLVQAKDGSWKIKKRKNWEKAEEILKQVVTHPEKGLITQTQFSENPVSTTPHHAIPSYSQTIEAKQEFLWQQLAKVKLGEALHQWLESIQNPYTLKSYSTSIDELISNGFLNPDWSLQQFSLLSPDQIIDQIKTSLIQVKEKNRTSVSKQWSMRTKEARIACFLSLTRYLSRKSEGMIRRGVPCKDGLQKTFSIKPRKVKSEALTRSQIVCFFEELDLLNPRDAMIARLCLQGGKRINEVLSLQTNQIDFEKKCILFHQSKSKFSDDFTVISFEKPAATVLLNDLKEYIGKRSGTVFITAKGKSIKQNQVDRNFMKAGKRAGILFRVSPHNLRATAVTLWKEDGFSDSLIMKATGHASSEMVHKYDKSDLAENVTKQSCLI